MKGPSEKGKTSGVFRGDCHPEMTEGREEMFSLVLELLVSGSSQPAVMELGVKNGDRGSKPNCILREQPRDCFVRPSVNK